MAEISTNGMFICKSTKARLEKVSLPKKKHTEYLVWTIVKSDSEIERDEVVVSMAETQNNWQVSKGKVL
jgi:hypothetical protein